MFERLRERAAVRRVSRRLAAARRAGRGIYVGEWHFEGGTGADLEAVCESILAWCRETLGRCHRPWGIDYFDLALSWSPAGPADEAPRSTRFPELRPGALYDGGLAERLAGFLGEVLQPAATSTAEQPGSVSIAAGLFSWGDAAYAAIPAAS